MKKKSGDNLPFPLFIAMVLAVGILFLLWGQNNSAATVYELGFLRYRASAQLDSLPEWAVTEAEQAALEAQRSKAEAEQAVLEAQRSKEEARQG